MCLLFVSWQSDHFCLRYSQFDTWPWKFKVKVKLDGPIWSLEFSRCVCFSFRGNRTIFGWDIANSIFDLGQGHDENRPKSNQLIYRSGPTIVQKMKEIQKVVQKLLRRQESAAGGGGVRTGTKTLSPPVYRGDLITRPQAYIASSHWKLLSPVVSRRTTYELINWTTNCRLYSNISQILVPHKIWGYHSKFDSMKSLGV